MENCFFKVLKIVDIRKTNCELVVGGLYFGQIDNNKVYFTDKAESEWVFYVNDSCQIINMTKDEDN